MLQCGGRATRYGQRPQQISKAARVPAIDYSAASTGMMIEISTPPPCYHYCALQIYGQSKMANLFFCLPSSAVQVGYTGRASWHLKDSLTPLTAVGGASFDKLMRLLSYCLPLAVDGDAMTGIVKCNQRFIV